MNYKVRVYMGQHIKDVILNNKTITVGSSDTDTLKIECSDIVSEHLTFSFDDGVWSCKDRVKGICKFIEDGDTFILSMSNRIAAVVYSCDIIPQRVNLKPRTKILIGRDFECLFHLPDRSVSRRHAEVITDELGTVIRDLESLNGTYLNNKKISEQALKDGDIISIGKYSILFKNSVIELCVDSKTEKSEIPEIKYPIFNLSPRLRHQTPSEVIEIQAPPNIGNMPVVNWLSFLPMLATRSTYSAVFPLTSLFSTFLQKKKYKKAREVRKEKYESYLADVKSKIDKYRDDQFLSLEESNHETDRCYDIAVRRERTLWERSSEDDDFMKIRIGRGDIETSFRIKFPDSVLKMYNDELENQGEELGKGNQILEGAPILCDLFNDLSIGIIGDREKTIKLAKNIIVQLTTTHSYKDIKLVTLFSDKESEKWDFVKWLPHSFSETREHRYIADNRFNISLLDKIIDEELKGRKIFSKEDSSKKTKTQLPFYVFIVTDPDALEKTEIENYLDNNRVGFGVGVIYVYENIDLLPRSCNVIIDIRPEKNEVFHKSNIGTKQEFEIDRFTDKKAEAFARSLAPVRLAEKKSTSDIPTCITFLEGHGAKTVSDLPVWENWNNTDISKSMAVPLGVRANGEQFMFNIMYGDTVERYHGSHGLLAGTNGSGKSEMLQSYILSMATKFSPEYLSFVIMDYKGTGMLRPFKDLPHLVGTISNLDGNTNRNIFAIDREIIRRQEIFKEVGVGDIREYFERNLHKSYKPLPIILIIIDEFAEIKKNLPEFIPLTETIFQIGRSLGMWAIVSTQKPGGVVTDRMNSNSKFSWCCRVATAEDSKEMIKRPDAARIVNAGRAFVRIGEDIVFEQVQSFWSGAPYLPDRKENIMLDLPVSMVDLSGKRIQYEAYKTDTGKDSVKEVDAVVDHIKAVAEKYGVEKAKPIWKDKLKSRIYLQEILPSKVTTDFVVSVGMIDNPHEQAQYPLEIDFTNNGHSIVYGAPSTGKTTFLQSFIMSAAKTYSPEQVNIYVMDFGSWTLNMFGELPHVGGVVLDNESEKMEKLINMLKKELDSRRKSFAIQGLSTIKAFNQENSNKLPYIVLVADNLNNVLSYYPDTLEFFENLVRQGANYGIYLMATANKENYKISQHVKTNSIALQLKEKSDYSAIVGTIKVSVQNHIYELVPENIHGRGLVSGYVRGKASALEFQTALPTYGVSDGEVLKNLKNEIRDIASLAKIKAKPIPIMPDTVSYDSVMSSGISLGLSADNIEPVFIDYLSEHHCVVISEEYKNEGFNMFKVILKQFCEKADADIVLYDNGSGIFDSLESRGFRKINEAEEFDEFIANLAAELNIRKTSKDLSSARNIVIAVSGYKEMYKSIDDKTASRLSAIVRMGKGLKVYLVVSETAGELASLSSIEPMIKNIISEEVGVLIGGMLKTHNAFNVKMDYTTSSSPLTDLEAYIVEKSKAVKIRTIQDK